MEKKRRGRPPKHNTPNELELKINQYFNSLEKPDGTSRPPTTAGLAHFLGFQDRQSLYFTKDRSPEFCCAIKKAILYIESFHEEHLFATGSTGSIFWLKNHQWRDQQEVKSEHSGPNGGPIDIGVRPVDTSTLSDTEKEALAKLAIKNMNLND